MKKLFSIKTFLFAIYLMTLFISCNKKQDVPPLNPSNNNNLPSNLKSMIWTTSGNGKDSMVITYSNGKEIKLVDYTNLDSGVISYTGSQVMISFYMGSPTLYGYEKFNLDGNGRATSVRAYNSNNIKQDSSFYQYDSNGFLTQVSTVDGKTSYSISNGNVISASDTATYQYTTIANNLPTLVRLDADAISGQLTFLGTRNKNLLSKIIYSDGTTDTYNYTYDNKGNVTNCTITGSDGVITKFTFIYS